MKEMRRGEVEADKYEIENSVYLSLIDRMA
jgi:hypothetical protein